jgi:hypothetical protein
MGTWHALAAAVAAAVIALAPSPWFARRLAGYRRHRDTISELGAAGARDARVVAWLWFFPAGLAVLVFCAALAMALPDRAGPALLLLSAFGLSYIGAAVFPCDPGAPSGGSARNRIHNLFGGAGYVGAGIGLIEIARVLEDLPGLAPAATAARFIGPCVLLGLVALSFPSPVRGFIQRMVEGAIFGWMLLTGIFLGLASYA